MIGHIVVLITVQSPEEGEKIAKALVEKRLAACVNIVPGLRSIYHWQGKICDDGELLLVAKTRDSLFERLEHEVKSIHSYKVPEIIALPIVKGSKEYLDWIDENTLA
ncbi:MAG: cation tolerance protein CutA [Deltaproteobacteria bacterium]|nr:cation tolerance protein CutA [Deltaproteobacteria bacterium]